MPQSTANRQFELRHLQLARAAFAAIAALMITFSSDHSAQVGLSVFSGFAIATGLVLLLGAWLVFPAGARGAAILLGVIDVAAGMTAGIPMFRSVTLFFVLIIAWAVVSGIAEGVAGWLQLRRAEPETPQRTEGRDAIVIGAATVALAIGLLLTPEQYALQYTIEEAGDFTLTGVTIGVGLFGGYAAIVAVFLAIAAFSPRRYGSVAGRSDTGESRA